MRKRRIDIARLLHVHAHRVAASARRLRDARGVLEGELGIDIEADVGELERDVRVEALRRQSMRKSSQYSIGCRNRFGAIAARLRRELPQATAKPRALAVRATARNSAAVSPATKRLAPRRMP